MLSSRQESLDGLLLVLLYLPYLILGLRFQGYDLLLDILHSAFVSVLGFLEQLL